MMAFPLQNIYNHSFQPLWKAKKKMLRSFQLLWKAPPKKKPKNKKGYGASGRRSVMIMLLHKSDKKYQTMIEICIMSGLEINISLSLSQHRSSIFSYLNVGFPTLQCTFSQLLQIICEVFLPRNLITTDNTPDAI